MSGNTPPSPDTILAEVIPNWLHDGQPFTVTVDGLHQFANETVEAHIFVLDRAAIWWHTSISLDINAQGQGDATRNSGLSVGHYGAVFVSEISVGDHRIHLPNVLVSIINSSEPGTTLNEVVAQYRQIESEQEALYNQPLGTPNKDANEFRAVCILENLFTTLTMRFPGVITKPLPEKLSDLERLRAVNNVLESLRWPTRISSDRWSSSTQANRPMTALIIPTIWARDLDEATSLVDDVQERLVSLLALNRRAKGRRVSLVIEQRPEAGNIKYRVFPPHEPYSGNLAGGLISGESQHLLASHYFAVASDPLLRLCCDLYGDALADRSQDAQYFRFVSILEILSRSRAPKRTPVTVSDGTSWPGVHNSTAYTAPRIYWYVSTTLSRKRVNERSLVAPAPDLYTAVRVWYGRRNATGHYGRFIAGDVAQKSQSWHQWAERSLHDSVSWLNSLIRTVDIVLQSELADNAPRLT